jgi:hypothetical protein
MIYMQDIERRKQLNEQGYWEIPDFLDTSNFDFTWRPDPYDRPYIHVFGTQHQKNGGPRFIVPDNEGTKYQSHQIAIKLPDPNNRRYRNLVSNIEFDYSWHPDENEPPFIHVFGNQWYDSNIMPTVQYKVPGATQKKYETDVKATLLPSKDNWTIPEEIDDSNFDYSWRPPMEDPYIYKFGTQWQRTGGPTYTVEGATQIKFVDTQKVIKLPNPRKFRVLHPIENFDYSWHPDEIEPPFLYVFGNQFYEAEAMPTLMYKCKGSSDTKYVNDISTKIKIDKVECSDSIYDSVRNHTFVTGVAHFYTNDCNTNYEELFLTKDKNLCVHIVSKNEAIVPMEVVSDLYDKLTDSTNLRFHNLPTIMTPLDIIFISNGENCADDNYEHLLKITQDLPNKVHRLDNIKGRVASQHAAANASTTPWYFLINAKLRVNPNFDFAWQPNLMKSSRHYVFTCTNPLNGLEYGHQAIVANSKKLTLNTVVRGLDFTMDSPHEIVKINSGISMYATNAWDTWRTAFRECVKLKHQNKQESDERLEIWTTVADGHYGNMSILGAKDAVEYYESVDGKLDKLMLSYDWSWLHEHYEQKYS